MSIQAVSVDELTGGSPVVVFAPTIADACLGCGALLAACFAGRGAFVITTLGAVTPARIAHLPSPARSVRGRAIPQPVGIDDESWSDLPDERRAVPDRGADEADLVESTAPLAALGGRASSIKALSETADGVAGPGRCPDRTLEGISELCRALGVRSLFLPLTRHRISPQAGIVEAAASQVCGANGAIQCWRYPVDGHGTMEDWVAGRGCRIRTLDTTPWQHAKREALARMSAAGFALPTVTGPVTCRRDYATRLAGLPERYLRSPGIQ